MEQNANFHCFDQFKLLDVYWTPPQFICCLSMLRKLKVNLMCLLIGIYSSLVEKQTNKENKP